MDVLIAALIRALLLLVSAGLLSCDGLVDASYRGEPVFSFAGQLVQFDDVAEQGYEFRTTLLWLPDPSVDPATQGPRLASAIEQASASVTLRFPAEFRIDIFAPPDDTMLVPGTGVGVALVVVYEDRDENGRLTRDARPSELVGGARYEAIVYARDDAAARAAPFEDPVVAGFQLVRIPLFCSGSDLPICEVPLGAPCEAASDCGEGAACIRELDGVVWPGGACTYAEDVVTCLPEDYVGLYLDAAGTPYLIAGCEDASECRDDYRCDEVYLGCVPEDAPAPDLPPQGPRRGAALTCAVELGAPCVVDADCGAGAECFVRSNGELFPNGYCALPIDDAAPAACEPRDGVAFPWRFEDDGRDTHWLAACDTEADCRVAEGYTCDVWVGACLPVSPVALELEPEFVPGAVCFGAFGRTR